MTPEERREWERRYATDTAHVNKSNVDKPQQVAPNDAKASRTNGQASRPRERRAQRSSSKASSPSGSDDDLDDSGPGGAGLLVRRRHTESRRSE
jgi:hypothetical protein